jgi:SnoaL-like domain
MDGMTDLEQLVAIQALKDLKARRDYAVDTKDWATYEAVHAPHHYSHNHGEERRDGAKANTDWVAERLKDTVTVHHSHTPHFEFSSPTQAKGIWGMEDNIFWTEDGEDCWLQGFGFYHETYEKIDEIWLFTSRALTRQKIIVTRKPQGSDA